MSKNIIFHCPFPLDWSAKSASGIRPTKMLQAFYDLGFNVDLVVGYSDERALAIKNIKQKIEGGYKYAFIYSESSTMPTALTDPHHIPLRPFLDFNFFNFLKKENIKIGLFYRDIHWMFDHYANNLPWYKKQLALFFYKSDLSGYQKYVDILYLPSLGMGEFLKNKISPKIFKELPPAHSSDTSGSIFSKKEQLNLLYVGGIGVNYNIKKIFDVVKKHKNILFTICTRENDWQQVSDQYGSIPENIRVIHESGQSVKELYQLADICVLFVEPRSYWKFAVPFKLYEYIGENKPILSTIGTFVGDKVSELDIGWALEYNDNILDNFFNTISSNDIETKFENLLSIKDNETWESRAQQVAEDLSR